MASNQDKLDYTNDPAFKVHLWNAGTDDEKFAQNNFIGRIVKAVAVDLPGAVAAKLLDWEIPLGGDQKTSLRTVIRWQSADFADVKARLDALSTQVAQSGGGVSLTKDEQAAIYAQAVKDSLGTYEVRKVEEA